MSFNIADFGIIGNRILAVSEDVGTKGWYIATIPDGLEQPEWQELSTPDSNGRLRIAGMMALLVDEDTSSLDSGEIAKKTWVNALLVNSATVTNVDNFAVYIDPETNEPTVKVWDQHYPNAEGGTADSMPYAGRCVMWGDFLVLGDIVWNADDEQPLTQENSTRYGHGTWFSIAGKTDTWDPIDTVFVGQKSGGNVMQGMFPLEKGLLTVTCTVVSLFQGSPDDFVYRELRSGISNCGRNGVAYWQNKGGVVWADSNDYIWYSDGEDFFRIDGSVEIENARSVTAVGEYLFVSTPTVTHVYRTISQDAAGWTRLATPFGYLKMIATEKNLFGIEDGTISGTFILDDPVYGLLDSGNTLWGDFQLIAAFDFDEPKRGVFNNERVISTIRSRPLPGGGHDKVFWHKFGVRAAGSGRVRKGVSRPSADPRERGYETRVSGRLEDRKDYVFDAHGPSLEATFDVEFEGDVTVEHMTVWSHGGATSK